MHVDTQAHSCAYACTHTHTPIILNLNKYYHLHLLNFYTNLKTLILNYTNSKLYIIINNKLLQEYVLFCKLHMF